MASRSILFIQTAFLGDVVLATAALEAWHAAHPEDAVDVLVRQPMEALFEGHPFVRHVHAWDKRPRTKGRDWRRLIRAIRKKRYDVVVNLHRHASSGVLTALSMAPVRLGYANNPLAWRFTHRKVHQWGDGTHEVERHMMLLSELLDNPQGEPSLYPGPEHRSEATKFAADQSVLVMPGSQWATKAWPEGQFSSLLDQTDGPVLLMGAPGERALCERLAKGRPMVSSAAGELSLLGVAAAIGMAKAVVVNDSAPMHMASAMDAPTVALFASTVPRFGFGPRSTRHVVLETPNDMACRPCGVHGRKRCPEGHFLCGWDLSVARVHQALLKVQFGDAV